MKQTIKILLIIIAAGLVMTACGGAGNVNLDPRRDEFYRNTRLLMTKAEHKVYKHLPDEAAKEAFIEEFWLRRDPDPATEQNEARLEHEARLEFIERWFNERAGVGGGVDSDRGKVFIVLGPPDERMTQERDVRDRYGNYVKIRVESWLYQRHRLFLEFRDYKGFGQFRLVRWTPDLLEAMEMAKYQVFNKKGLDRKFAFKAKYRDNRLVIRIPSGGITFDNADGNVTATFKVTVRVYLDNREVDKLEVVRNVTEAGEKMLKKDKVELTVPYELTGKGKYTFDVVVEDVKSEARYRNVTKTSA